MYGSGQRGPGLGIGPAVTPPIIKKLLIAHLGVFMAQYLLGLGGLAVVPAAVWQGGYLWQPFTYMWLHDDRQLLHIVMNCFMLWMFGSQLAMAWGANRFLRYYLVCGIGAGWIIATWPYVALLLGGNPLMLHVATLGASGAIYGVILAYSLTWPDRTIMLIFPPVAFRAIWLIPALFFMTVAFGGGNVSHIGHLGGVLAGWLYLRRHGGTGRLFGLKQIKYRWRRHRMRRKLRSIRYDDYAERQQDDHTLH